MNIPDTPHILVVDDDSYVLASTTEILKDHGCHVHACDNVECALNYLGDKTVDMILSDIKMPSLTGLDLLERVKEMNSDLPVILMTGYADLDTSISAIKKGAFDFITKPFDPDQLTHAVEKAVRHTRLLQIDKEYRKMLENAVKERTIELRLRENLEEIKAARDAALKALSVKSEFIANMSHELRTPMNGIVGMINLTLGTQITPQQEKYLTMAKTASETMLSLLNDLLDFSRMEAGKFNIEHSSFNLHVTVRTVIDCFMPQAIQKHLDLESIISPDVPEYAIGDSVRLKQILNNLINNAIKFTEEGRVVVSVAMGRVVDRETEVVFTVEDTGIGIPEDRIGDIFDAFTQVDGSYNRKYGGTGLGLAIVKQLVELMNGRITIESTIGKGSIFRFVVRLEMTPSTQSEPKTYPAKTTAPSPETHEKRPVSVSPAVSPVPSDSAWAVIVSKLKKELSASNTEAIEEIAHKLQTQAKTSGNTLIDDISFRIKLAARKEDFTGLALLISRLEKHI